MAIPQIPKFKPLENTSGSTKNIVKGVLIGALALLLGAFGLEATNTDFDLGKLLGGSSVQDSKVARDEKGNVVYYDKEGNATTDTSKGKKASDYNCEDFSTQPEAQRFLTKVGVSNDIYRLDGDNDRVACEDLPNSR